MREVRPDYWLATITIRGEDFSATARGAGPAGRQAALEALAEKTRRARVYGVGPQAGRVGVVDYLAAWLAGRQAATSARQWANHERNVTLHLAPLLGRLRLVDLTTDDLRRIYARLVRPPQGRGTLAPKTVREVHGTLRQALEQAVEDGLVARNVAASRALHLPPLDAPRPHHTLTSAELARFWTVAAADRLAALYVLAALLPTRSGELRALRWSDLDERRRALVIRRSVARSGDAGRLLEAKAPKTRAGIRLLDLDDDLLALLRAHRARQHAERLRAGAAWVDHDLIFCSRYGTPLLAGNLRRDFRKLLARAGVDDAARVRFHDLRHTAVSALLAAGVPPPEVSQLAGHANTQVTTAIYAHAIRRSSGTALGQVRAFHAREGAALESRERLDAPGASTAPGADDAAMGPARAKTGG